MTPYYDSGGIIIYHGDCREVVATCGLPSVSCVVTSPPYNLHGQIAKAGTGMWGKRRGGLGMAAGWKRDGYPDSMNEEEYQSEQTALFDAIAGACSDDASLFYNHQLRWRNGCCLHPVQWFRPARWSLRQEIIWARGRGMMFNSRMFVRTDERILWMVRDRWKWNHSSVGLGTVWPINCVQKLNGYKAHPAEYPSAIPSRCILATTDPGDVVLDPFMGSGTTLLAAKLEGRRAIGIEREERYCEVAAKRLAQGVIWGPEDHH